MLYIMSEKLYILLLFLNLKILSTLRKLLQIILSQEKSIQKLNKLVQSLQEQLVQCRVINGDIDDPASPLAELLHELEQQQLLDA